MKPVNVAITKVVEETPTIRTFFFDTSFELIPGQFVMVWIRGVDEIPMALSYENAITVQKVGHATSGAADRRNDVAAVTEGKDGELDPQLVAEFSAHVSGILLV